MSASIIPATLGVEAQTLDYQKWVHNLTGTKTIPEISYFGAGLLLGVDLLMPCDSARPHFASFDETCSVVLQKVFQLTNVVPVLVSCFIESASSWFRCHSPSRLLIVDAQKFLAAVFSVFTENSSQNTTDLHRLFFAGKRA